MNRRWRRAAAAVAAALMFTIPAMGAEVALNGGVLPQSQGWVENGTSYIALRTYAEHMPYALTWNGRTARMEGEGLELEVRPGQPYLTVNGRALYVEGGVRVVEGRIVLPLRVLAQATGAEVRWDQKTATAALDLENAQPPQASYGEEELYWLSRVISAESRGEPLLGQLAVGNVVLNRVKSSEFPNTVKGVVFDKKNGVQFEPTANGTIYDQPTESAVLAAKLCLEGTRVVGDSLYFYAPALSAGRWIVNNRSYYTTIGCHRFYR